MVNLKENTDFSQKIPVKRTDLKSVVEDLLDSLSAKQKLVLSSRFGIGNGEPKTLEAIGKSLNITRERVRQIEGDAVKALKKYEEIKNLGDLVACVNDVIKENGGIIKAGKIAKETYSKYSGKEEFSSQEARALEIVFLMTGIKKMRANREVEESWVHADFDKKYFKAAVDELEMVFDSGKKVLTAEEVLKKIDHSQFSQKFPRLKPEHILSFLEVSKKFGQNVFGDWGKARWPLIRPRGVREKATLVLMKKRKPLHFREISRLIGEMKLSEKKVHPQTVHNELIRDSRFVLVGRGTYALREWGFEEGTVKDVIVNLLMSAGGFLKKEKLYEEVLGKRKVKKATISVNLANKQVFEKKGDGYQLKKAKQETL
jgi:hypothetical protein